MPYLVNFPKANALQVVRERENVSAKYHLKHYDEWWWKERLQAWEGRQARYYQKFQFNDTIRATALQSNGGNAANVYVLDRCGKVVAGGGTAAIDITGATITDQQDGNTYDATIHDYQQQLGILQTVGEGIYYFRFEFPFYEPTDPMADANGYVYQYWISEPVSLRKEHKDTILVQYKNSYNKEDVYYKQLGLTFNLRIESWIYNFTPMSEDTTFVDERVDLALLGSTPSEGYTLGLRHSPEYILNKINRAFSCDVVRLDNKLFTKQKDAKFEVNLNPNSPFKGITLAIQYAQNWFSTQGRGLKAIEVFKVTAGDMFTGTRFPYFIKQLRINRTGGIPINLLQGINGNNTVMGSSNECKEIRDAADEAALLAYFNANTNLGGTFTYIYTGNDIKCVYSPDEDNITGSTKVILTKHILNTFTNSWGTGTFFDIKGSHIGYAYLNEFGIHKEYAWGNGNPGITHSIGTGNILLVGLVTRIYHFNQGVGDTISTYVSAGNGNLKSVSGLLPATLVEFTVHSSGAYTQLDASIFIPCRAVIFKIDMYNNGITQVNPTSWSFNYQNEQLTTLAQIIFSRNKFTSNSVNNIFFELYNGGGTARTYTQNNGQMFINLQSPLAPPTAASATARNDMSITKNWTVITD